MSDLLLKQLRLTGRVGLAAAVRATSRSASRARSRVLYVAGLGLTLLSTPLHAQDPGDLGASARRWTFDVTGGHANLRDRVFNNTVYSGATFGVAFGREWRAGNRLQHGRLGTRLGKLANRYDLPALLVEVDARYAHGRRVGLCAPAANCYLGLSIGGGPKMHHFEEEDADHIYWITSYDLAARLDVRRNQPGLGEVGLEVELPLAGIVSRPAARVEHNNDVASAGYLVRRIHGDLRVATLPAFRGARLAVAYHGGSARRLGAGVRYELVYDQYAEPREVQRLSHRISASLVLRQEAAR
jgi:hypothetical protein